MCQISKEITPCIVNCNANPTGRCCVVLWSKLIRLHVLLHKCPKSWVTSIKILPLFYCMEQCRWNSCLSTCYFFLVCSVEPTTRWTNGSATLQPVPHNAWRIFWSNPATTFVPSSHLRTWDPTHTARGIRQRFQTGNLWIFYSFRVNVLLHLLLLFV